MIGIGPRHRALTNVAPIQTVTVEPPNLRAAFFFVPPRAPASLMHPYCGVVVASSHATGLTDVAPGEARPGVYHGAAVSAPHAGRTAPPVRTHHPTPYRNLGARRAHPTQPPCSTGSDRPQTPRARPAPQNQPHNGRGSHGWRFSEALTPTVSRRSCTSTCIHYRRDTHLSIDTES